MLRDRDLKVTATLYSYLKASIGFSLAALRAFCSRDLQVTVCVPLRDRDLKVTATLYSYLSASIGFSLAAFRAGYQPKKIPTKAAAPKE